MSESFRSVRLRGLALMLAKVRIMTVGKNRGSTQIHLLLLLKLLLRGMLSRSRSERGSIEVVLLIMNLLIDDIFKFGVDLTRHEIL